MCLGNGWSQTFRFYLDFWNNDENENYLRFLKKLASYHDKIANVPLPFPNVYLKDS